MDWQALRLSVELAVVTLLILLPVGIVVGRWLAVTRTRWKPWLQGALALPLVLPPTVLGFYVLVAVGGQSALGRWFEAVFGHTLAFSFSGLVVASVLFNIPFTIQPIERAFEAIPSDIRDVATCCGMSPMRSFWRIEFPLAWPGVLSASVLTFAHTLGEFDSLDGKAAVRWGSYRLNCKPPARVMQPGQSVHWCINAGHIVLHREDRPSRAGADNPVDCLIDEVLVLGDESRVWMRPQALPEARLLMKLSDHIARRNRLEEGGTARVSLTSSAIQPLPDCGDRATAADTWFW